jgi:murein DD-endopeptidase MepM/ murein hydrolase activator NlpD
VAFNPITGIKDMTSGMKSFKKELDDVLKTIQQISTTAPSAVNSLKSIKNSSNGLGKGNSLFNTNDAEIPDTGASKGNKLADAMPLSAAQREARQMYRMTGMTPTMAKFSMYGGMAQGVAGLVGAGYAMFPDLGTVASRAAGFYGASIAGGMSRTALQTSTVASLNGRFGRGVSGVGDDAAAAAMLVQGYNYAPGSAAYQQTMGEIGGAARYLNMNNATAAQAIGGFQTGPMGANLYQYGISQFDAQGNPVSQATIAKQLYNRMFQKGASAKDVQMSLQYGMAGANLSTMGFSQEQQSILAQQFKMIASGQNPDLASQSGSANPLAPAQQITASQTDLIQRAEAPMLKGFADAASAVSSLNKSLEGLPDAFFQLKGALQGFNGGTNGALGIATGGITSGISNYMLGKSALKMFGKMGKAATSVEEVGSGGMGALGTVGAVAGGAVVAGGAGYVMGKGAKMIGKALHATKKETRAGGTLAGAGTGALIGAGIPVLGELGIGEVGGAIIGGLAGFFGSGGASVGFGASFGAKGGGSVQSPIPGAAPTTGYGAKGSIWSGSNNTHKGQDYAVPVGTPVEAVMSGTVIDEHLSSDYGTYVQIDHGNGYQTIYGHLSSKSVNVGDHVNSGQVIGKSGATGNVDGPHLHFEVRKGKNNPVDPAQLMGGASVLSPNVSGGAQVTRGVILGTGSQKSWATTLLKKLGDPTTPQNVAALTTWAAYEGGHWKNTANYNPLNTTQPEKGATNMNSVGVKSYSSWSQGYQATIDTLNNGRYGNILNALKSGKDTQAVLSAVNSSPWGTHIPAAKGGGSVGYGASMPSSGGSVNNTFNMPITLQNGNDEELLRVANRVKSLIDSSTRHAQMGSK